MAAANDQKISMSQKTISQFRRLCVFCGSGEGARPDYTAQGEMLGRILAGRGITLIYGGGGIGVMGAVARGAIENGGEVIGIIPHALATKERAHPQADLRIVNTMHERKAMMAEMSDGFIVLPGGFGTFEEMFEVVTWAQLGIHRKPVALLNVAGYFDPLMAMIDRAIEERLIQTRYRDLIIVSSQIEELLERMAVYQAPESIVQWIEMEET